MAPAAASKATQVDGPKASAATVPKSPLPAKPSVGKPQAGVPSRQPNVVALAAKPPPTSIPSSKENSAHGPTVILPAAKAVMAYDDVWATPRSIREILAHVPEKGASWESSLYWHYHPWWRQHIPLQQQKASLQSCWSSGPRQLLGQSCACSSHCSFGWTSAKSLLARAIAKCVTEQVTS